MQQHYFFKRNDKRSYNRDIFDYSQDKALRRISELKEQCQLEQKAKRHLEEELRSDLEEKQHVISALETKVTLLKSGGKSVIDENGGGGDEDLVDLDPNENHEDRAGLIKRDSEKVASLEGKIFSTCFYYLFSYL